MVKVSDHVKFNIFSFVSSFARALIEIFISLYLFKNGFTVRQIVAFYFFVNIFAMPLSYYFVKLGEKTKYIYVMIIGLIGFIVIQLVLRNVIFANWYLILIAFLYSVYRRGYWVARRFYITKIMPDHKSSGYFSIVSVLGQVSSILAGYVGSVVLNNLDFSVLTIISSVLLFSSIIPLCGIKYKKTNKKINLRKALKKYKKTNYLAFSMFELNNILSFIFPVYIAIYVENSYTLAGNLNAISNVAIILFILIYGKMINRDNNYVFFNVFLLLVCSALKLFVTSYFILAVYFIEGIVSKTATQSVNKIYFESRGKMDLTHYNLIYQLLECFVRALVCLPLLFMNDIKMMIILVIVVMFILLVLYTICNKQTIKR